jgi:hypothetical protein
MDTPARTLVAVMSNDADHQTHTLYFSDGTVVGYDPTTGRVLRVHRLPADFGEAQRLPADASPRMPIGDFPSHLDRGQEGRD